MSLRLYRVGIVFLFACVVLELSAGNGICQSNEFQLQVFLQRSYKVDSPELKRQAEDALLSALKTGDEGDPVSVNIEWLNYDRALDFAAIDEPAIAILTTGMYCRIRTFRPGVSDIKVHGAIKLNGVATYKFFIIVKPGEELSPDNLKGHLVLKKKTSLSGSVFPLYYLHQHYGFPKELIFDDELRKDWLSEVQYHGKFTEKLAANETESLFAGEGLDSDRATLEANGWDVYPKPEEPEADFEITRALVLTRNLPPSVEQRLTDFLFGSSANHDEFFRIIKRPEGVTGVNEAVLQAVLAKYQEIYTPNTPSQWSRLLEKVLSELGLYLLAITLMILAHFVFRYYIGEVKDPIGWIVLIIVIKFAAFVVLVWLLPPTPPLFIATAIVIGAADPQTILKLMRKFSASSPAGP